MDATTRALLAAVVVLVTACGAAAPQPSGPNVVDVGKTSATSTVPPAPKHCEGKHVADIDADTAEGLRIVDVCLTGASPETIAAVRKVLTLRADKKLTAEALRGDLEAAYKTGRIDQIEATAQTGGGGVLLMLAVKERPRIASVKLEAFGATATGEDAAAALAKPGDPLDIPKLFATEAKIRESFVDDGWDDAQVAHDIRFEGDGRANVTIKVTPGVRQKVGKVTFDGAQAALVAPLRKAIEMDEGTSFGPARLERAALLANAFYYDRGFMTVRIDTPKKARGADGVTAISFKIVEGPVFRIGALKAKGVDAATEKDVLSKFTSKPGEVFSRAKVVKDLDAIRALLKDRGKPNATVEPETDLDPKKGIVDITVGISGF